MTTPKDTPTLIPPHSGSRDLKSYHMALCMTPRRRTIGQLGNNS